MWKPTRPTDQSIDARLLVNARLPLTQMLAVSSPRGGLVGFWALPAGKWEGHIELADGCGLAPGPEGGILASSGSGRVGRWAETRAPAETSEHAFRRWDNHMTAIA